MTVLHFHVRITVAGQLTDSREKGVSVKLKEVEVYFRPDGLGRATILQDADGSFCIWLLRVGEQLHAVPEPGMYRSLDEARSNLSSLRGFSHVSSDNG